MACIDRQKMIALLEQAQMPDEEEEVPEPMTMAEECPEGMCVECADHPGTLQCIQCDEIFCEVCFRSLHKKGKRAVHVTNTIANPLSIPSSKEPAAASRRAEDMEVDTPDITPAGDGPLLAYSAGASGAWFEERAKYIPLRMAYEERKFLRLVEAALNVSEYTDKIDVIQAHNKTQRICQQLKDVCAILCGLVVASDYKKGQELIVDKEFKDHATFFQYVLELARRHKIRNPEKMRDAYGKLMYLLQDSVKEEVRALMEFDLVQPIQTVYSLLAAKNALHVLHDPDLVIATSEVMPEGRSRPEIQRAIKKKEKAIETIARKYTSSQLGYEEIRQCIVSICDNHNFLRFNRDSCDKMMSYLTTLFDPKDPAPRYSLEIHAGGAGARLTHSHARQYCYVLQSLTLWRDILHDMFKLWYLSEQDLLDPQNPYRLRDTGQGLNRVQAAPRVSRVMHNILYQAQQKVGGWVGSSVIHLGDHNVPNALMFIDKYNQVSRILNPIVITLAQLDKLHSRPDLGRYIDQTFGGVDQLRLEILQDFFKHAFDGSGADNFFDAGSCIDGRLTSAWNWCSRLEKKRFHSIFLLTGFAGFDGQF